MLFPLRSDCVAQRRCHHHQRRRHDPAAHDRDAARCQDACGAVEVSGKPQQQQSAAGIALMRACVPRLRVQHAHACSLLHATPTSRRWCKHATGCANVHRMWSPATAPLRSLSSAALYLRRRRSCWTRACTLLSSRTRSTRQHRRLARCALLHGLVAWAGASVHRIWRGHHAWNMLSLHLELVGCMGVLCMGD